jgi:hypothetical protein
MMIKHKGTKSTKCEDFYLYFQLSPLVLFVISCFTLCLRGSHG